MPATTPTTPHPPLKPGWQTSEFWAVVAYAAAVIVTTATGVPVDPVLAASLGGVIAAYALGRALPKAEREKLIGTITELTEAAKKKG